ncbi:DUF3618 domain-containing protein [Devosia sp. PTR5]|uniref:DUF3618 domain-containing protein n=1 Tax=Devosia oryzisoli TaxID=2774138 RepID=A0A927INZ2_9HYPH|nr:DUF3618 domain-containing protein [Devosia oryzisoli]MBD8063990.1 DUF3618 domain-containing protein [Devosia oryzisoli]
MAYDDHKSSAELQREVEQQRARLEDRIDSISEKLSPGQLVDELLTYTKGGGGAFVSSLQRNVTANPLPVALLGVSLAWLMAKPAPAAGTSTDADRAWDDSINGRRGYDGGETLEDDYPVAVITGTSLRRVSHRRDESGNHVSEFLDDAGKKYKAASDAAGRRAGHFVDETGKSFRGFTDAAGTRVEQFRDEAGNMLDEASGWASHNWRKAKDMLHGARHGLSQGMKGGAHHAAHAGEAMSAQVNSLNQTIMQQFKDQPLVAGALAFAVGAAFGAALPHTEQEDALMGDAADSAKSKLGEEAEHLYDQGREKASELYETATERAGDLYNKARDGVAEAGGSTSGSSTSGSSSGSGSSSSSFGTSGGTSSSTTYNS